MMKIRFALAAMSIAPPMPPPTRPAVFQLAKSPLAATSYAPSDVQDAIRRYLDQALNEDAGRVDVVRVQLALLHDRLLDLRDRAARGHRHDRVVVALRPPIDQVAEGIGLPGPQEGVVGGDRLFQDVRPTVEIPMLLPL